MLHTISWQQYSIFIFLLLVVYYLYVVFKYYRIELTHLLTGGGNIFAAYEKKTNNKNIPTEDVSSLSPVMHDLLDITKLICEGHAYKIIGNTLFISKRTVTKHVQNIFEKLGVSNKIGLINKLQT
ncbi:MAG: response regulator transcription factor [Chitinophagaceae bacterium]